VFARGSNRKNKAVPADPGCSGVPGFPYTQDSLSHKLSNHRISTIGSFFAKIWTRNNNPYPVCVVL